MLHRLTSLPALAVLFVAVGCSSSDDTAGPAVPTPSAQEAALCRALHKQLPQTVGGLARHAPEHPSDFTAAWGDPAIALRCGVARPKVLTPGTEHYNPTADAVELNGVDWLPEKQDDGSIRCTTTMRKAFVEVTIPAKVAGGAGDMSALTDLAGAVEKTIPEGL
jgi:hypothetical protein